VSFAAFLYIGGMKFSSRRRARVALLLMILQLCGARVHARNDACGKGHIYFGPARSFRAAVKHAQRWVKGEKWERKAPRSFGEARNHNSSQDLDCLRCASKRLAPVEFAAETVQAVPTPGFRPAPRLLAKLPSDISPVLIPHLHSKK
jgi:hypothetical protein